MSPKVKVDCINGLIVDDETSIRTFVIKAINHGNVSVTLSGVGLEFQYFAKNPLTKSLIEYTPPLALSPTFSSPILQLEA